MFHYLITGYITVSYQSPSKHLSSFWGALYREYFHLKERHIMHLIFTPILANALYIGGGSVGLILVIVVVILLLRG
jgi:hypothetical protein